MGIGKKIMFDFIKFTKNQANAKKIAAFAMAAVMGFGCVSSAAMALKSSSSSNSSISSAVMDVDAANVNEGNLPDPVLDYAEITSYAPSNERVNVKFTSTAEKHHSFYVQFKIPGESWSTSEKYAYKATSNVATSLPITALGGKKRWKVNGNTRTITYTVRTKSTNNNNKTVYGAEKTLTIISKKSNGKWSNPTCKLT